MVEGLGQTEQTVAQVEARAVEVEVVISSSLEVLERNREVRGFLILQIQILPQVVVVEVLVVQVVPGRHQPLARVVPGFLKP
jgi:hypothetical protein